MVASRQGRGSRIARLDVLALAAALWFLGKFLRYAFPPLFETLGSTYGVSRTALGTAFTGFMLVYAAMQFPSGLLADRLGPVRVIAGGAVVTAAGSLVLVVDSPFVVLAGAMLVLGAGTGAHKTVAVGLLSRVYRARTGRALGVFDTAGSLAGAAAPAAVVVALGLPAMLGAPWRTLFLVGGLAGLGLAVGFVRRVPRRLPASGDDAAGEEDASGASADSDSAADSEPSGTTGADTSGADLRQYARLFADPWFAAFVVVTVLFSFAYNGLVAFLPLYLTTEAGLSTTTANLLYSALFVASFVQLATGEASDRVGTLPVLVVTLAVATAGLGAMLALSAGGVASAETGGALVLSTGVDTLALGGAVVALGLGAHGYRPVRGAYLMEIIPERASGGGLGVVRTLLMGAGAVAPAVVGYLSESDGFQTAFGLLAAALVAATALTAGLLVLERT